MDIDGAPHAWSAVLSYDYSMAATRTSLLMGLPSSFTARGSAAVAPCCRMSMASCWVWPSKLTRSGTVVTLAASAESVASSEAMAATSCHAWSAVLSYDYSMANASDNLADTVRTIFIYVNS